MKQWESSSFINTAITTVLAKFSTHCLLSHYFSREAIAIHIIVDDTDSMNKFALLSGKMRGQVYCLHTGMTVMVFYNWSLKFRSQLVLYIPFKSPVSFLKIADHISIASFLLHNSWTITALFPDYLKLRSELVPNKSSNSVPALCSHMAISEKLVKTYKR